jgi:hypothetical protein
MNKDKPFCPLCGVKIRDQARLARHMIDKCPQSPRRLEEKRNAKIRPPIIVYFQGKPVDPNQLTKNKNTWTFLPVSWKWSGGTMSGTNCRHKCRYISPIVRARKKKQ